MTITRISLSQCEIDSFGLFTVRFGLFSHRTLLNKAKKKKKTMVRNCVRRNQPSTENTTLDNAK